MVTCIVATVGMGDAMIYNVLPSNVSAFGVAVGLVGVLLAPTGSFDWHPTPLRPTWYNGTGLHDLCWRA